MHNGLTDWPALVNWFTLGPAKVLHLPAPALRHEEAAELTLIDPRARWTVRPECFLGKSVNSPYLGRTLVGRAVGTIRGTRLLRLR